MKMKEMLNNLYAKAEFLTNSSKISQLPADSGYEVAFAGRSNAGKSSALNCLTNQKSLARTSKTPGRTQLINLFSLDENRRLVDLPGYGYAKVALALKEKWQKNLSHYLEARQCLKGLILVMDCRHPLKDLDLSMIEWSLNSDLLIHLLLTKSDKISRSDLKNTVLSVEKKYKDYADRISVQGFSSVKKDGLSVLITRLNSWFEL